MLNRQRAAIWRYLMKLNKEMSRTIRRPIRIEIISKLMATVNLRMSLSLKIISVTCN